MLQEQKNPEVIQRLKNLSKYENEVISEDDVIKN